MSGGGRTGKTEEETEAEKRERLRKPVDKPRHQFETRRCLGHPQVKSTLSQQLHSVPILLLPIQPILVPAQPRSLIKFNNFCATRALCLLLHPSPSRASLPAIFRIYSCIPSPRSFSRCIRDSPRSLSRYKLGRPPSYSPSTADL